MASTTKAGFPEAMTLTSKLQEIKSEIPHVVMAGNVDEVNKLKTRLVNLRKTVAGITKTFDDAVVNAQSGMLGEDFLSGVTTIIDRANKGRKPKVVTIDETDFL